MCGSGRKHPEITRYLTDQYISAEASEILGSTIAGHFTGVLIKQVL